METEMEDSHEKFIVTYQNQKFDITSFVHKHPGGTNSLKGLQNADMTARFLNAPPHSSAANYLMNEYKIKTEEEEEEEIAPNCNGINRKTYENGKLSNGHAAGEKMAKRDDQNSNEVPAVLDESMEHIVDWSKAMLPQIHTIADNYTEWVNKPVDRPLRLFEPWYLEILTKTPWWTVPSFWIPTISFIIHNELVKDKSLTKFAALFYVFAGIALWTLIEYTLHRWVFHIKINGRKPWLCTFHFVLHGLHHKVPFDPYRLVFPPLPAAVIASILYLPLCMFLPKPRLILAGGLIGYVIYDLMHYYLHYGSPLNWFLYHMKRYHYQHHFVHHDIGFGISSPIWDFVFQTRICLRKLKYVLKWE